MVWSVINLIVYCMCFVFELDNLITLISGMKQNLGTAAATTLLQDLTSLLFYETVLKPAVYYFIS